MNNPIIVPMSVSEPESIPMTVSDGETLNFDMRGLFLQGGGGAVTGVKGNAEVDFRTGDVNLSPADLGIDLASLATKSELPTKTSDLTNDSNFVSDAHYVHTEENFTTVEKTKLNGLHKLTILINSIAYDVTYSVKTTMQGIDGIAIFYDDGSPDGSAVFIPDADGFITFYQMIQQTYATKSEVPDSTSDLVNDSGFITASSIPTNVSSFANDAGYLTLGTLPIWNGSIT